MRPSPVSLAARRHLAALAVAALASFGASSSLGAQGSETTKAVAHFDQGEYATARAELEAILRRNPGDATALYYMGRLAARDGKSGEAVDWFEKAIAIDDRNPDYHVMLGSALGDEAQKASKFRQPFLARRVKTEFEKAVALDPRNTTARFALVQFYGIAPGFLGGGMDKARAQLAELTKISALHGHVGDAWLAMRQKDTVGAIRAYEAAIAAAPDSALGYLSLGALQTRLERWPDAFATYERMMKRRPDDMIGFFQYGRTAALSGQNLERGEQAIRLFLAKPPKNVARPTLAGAHHRLGQILEKRGNRDGARQQYEEALRINPDNGDARKALAAVKAG